MSPSRRFVVIGFLVVLSLCVTDSYNRGFHMNDVANVSRSRAKKFDENTRQDSENISMPPRTNILSDSTLEGILNPADVEQSGFISTGFKNARTDTNLNTNTTLDIDTTNGWLASEARTDIWNLERRYAVNGTFDDGIPGEYVIVNDTPIYYPYGWRADRTTTNTEQEQIAGYDDDGFVIVENQGRKVGPSGRQFTHEAGTKILWKQNITNAPYTKNFTLNLRYMYVRGPLYGPGGATDPGDCSLKVFVNGSSVWSQSLPNLTQRNVWIETGDVPVNIGNPGNTLEFAVGIVIDETMALNADEDYNNDSLSNGFINTIYIRTQIDDISFTGLNPPSFEEVNFEFHAGNETTAATGSLGNGSAMIPKTGYWSVEQLDIAFTSNVSISFGYEARLLEHRFLNSSWTTNAEETGVSYTVYYNQSAELILHTYVGTQGDYQDFNVTIRYPPDWENLTVYNPFLSDVTVGCTITQGKLHIPTPLLSSLGWWEVRLESPNYGKSLTTQKYADPSGWVTTNEFRPDNITRASVDIGTVSDTPVLSDPVNLTWYLPNNSVWWYESSSSAVEGSLNTSSVAFGAMNTTAGEWHIEMRWSNGSEIAYMSSSFSLYHLAVLTPEYGIVEGDVGQTITNVLRFQNGYTGEYLMDDDAIVIGNWSGDSVQFAPNVIKNWWEGDFDTSLSGGGNFTVLVQTSKPFYDNTNCTFHIVATYTTQMEIDAPQDVPAESGMNEPYTLNVSYRFSNGTGIEEATIEFEYSGTTGGLDIGSVVPQGSGDYQVAITGRQSGTYIVTVESSKKFHHSQSDSFTLIVNETGTILTQVNGTACFVRYGLDYRYVVQYENSTGSGLEGANISVENVEPSAGLGYDLATDVGDGYYSILFTASNTTTYTIVIKATKTNHETQYGTFTLTVTEVPTTLTLNVTSETISVYDQFVLGLSFEDESGTGVSGATITPESPPADLEISSVTDNGDGNYSLVIDPMYFGTYLLTFSASRSNYKSAVDSFSLVVDAVDTSLTRENGTAATLPFGETYNLVVRYVNSSGYGIEGAWVSIVSVTPETGLDIGITHDLGEGYYSILLNATSTDTYNTLIEANYTNHKVQYATFTLTVTEIPTSLTLNVSSVTISVEEQLILGLVFKDEFGTGVPGATITAENPPAELDISTATDYGDGNYSLIIRPMLFGSYLLTFSASKGNYLSGYDSFSLNVDEVGTTLIRQNGTADSIRFGQSYNLVVRYVNSSGYGLFSANVTVSSVSPEIGISIGTTEELDDGYYSILLTSTLADTYTIVVKASLTNHKTQFTTFSLTISEIPTSLTSSTTSNTIAFDLTQTVNLTFVDEDLNRLENATISVLNAPGGLGVSDIKELGDGVYQVILDPSETGSYSILLRASLTNYQNSTVGFSLLVKEIPTNLEFLRSSGSAAVNFSEPFNLEMVYARTDLNQNITGANVSIALIQPYGPSFAITASGEIYNVIFDTCCTGSWTINIEVNKENHESKIREFKLTVENIDTRITDLTLQDDLLYNHTYSLDYYYLIDANRTGISEADISVSGIDSDWIQVFYQGAGLYRINLTPTSLGAHSVIFTFSKTGYVAGSSTLEFRVDEVPVSISILDELTDIAGREKTLRIRIYEKDTNRPVSNATVTYLIFGSESGLMEQGAFSERSNGIYVAIFRMPSADNQDYHLEIRMDKANHFMEESSGTYALTPYLSEGEIMSRFVTTYVLPPSIIGVGLVVAYGAYVIYRRKKREEISEQNRIKRIFADAQNLLGVLILHTKSGVPLYSRIIKKGLDDTVISAFISAITQFKAEFDLASPYEEWDVTPISDLIRIVATENLICAFIVLREPSDSQKEKMKLFAQEVASIWRDVYQETPSEVLDSETKRQFDELFDDILDARLLKKHRVANASNLPDQLQFVEEGTERIEADGFLLQNLVQSLATRGIEERKAYSIIMNALENGAIEEEEHPVNDGSQEFPSSPLA